MSISWVDWFLTTPAGRYFVRIDDGYLSDTYNYYGLRQKVPNFSAAFELIRGPRIEPGARPAEWPEDIDSYGACLFGLLHARYLLTDEGQRRMRKRCEDGAFPHCPRTLCRGAQCLPYGAADDIGQSELLLFCPCCGDVYRAGGEAMETDGAFFGPNWVHPFLARYRDLVPSELPERYVPRIFGFHVAQE